MGAGAFGVAADPILIAIYVSCRDGQVVHVVDGATNALLQSQSAYPDGMPYALGLDPGLGQLYVAFAPEADDPRQVLVYRVPATGPSLLATVDVGHGGPDGGGGVVANPMTHHVFVTNAADDSLTIFDGVTARVLGSVFVGDDPMGVAVDPGLGRVFIGDRMSNIIVSLADDFR